VADPSPFLLFPTRLAAIGVRSMVSGGVASIVYGEPRFTHDIDLIVILEKDQIARLPAAFPLPEFYCPPASSIAIEAAREFRGHFNLLHIPTGFRADVYLTGRDPLHAWAWPRARSIEIGGGTLLVAPPEYVIVRKLEFHREGGSERHLRDIRTMLDHSSSLIDFDALGALVRERGVDESWSLAQAFGRG